MIHAHLQREIDRGPHVDVELRLVVVDQMVVVRIDPRHEVKLRNVGALESQLDDAIFGAIGPKLQKGEFFGKADASKAHDLNDRIIYDSASGKLYYDDDGNTPGGHAPVLFATLSNKPVLDQGDFIIV